MKVHLRDMRDLDRIAFVTLNPDVIPQVGDQIQLIGTLKQNIMEAGVNDIQDWWMRAVQHAQCAKLPLDKSEPETGCEEGR